MGSHELSMLTSVFPDSAPSRNPGGDPVEQ
jgi:hypothetical protein